MKRITTLVLMTIIIGLIQNPMYAKAETTFDIKDTQYDLGASSEYIAIHNKEELEQIGTRSSVTEKYYLANDIDLSGQEWVPLSFYCPELIIDGKGHSIKNMTVISDSEAGFFSLRTSTPGKLTVSNVSFENVKLEGEYSGAICGFLSPGGWLEQRYTFSNINVSGTISGTSKVGGLIGYVGYIYDEEGYIKFTECTNNANLISASNYGNDSVGGIVGAVGGSLGDGKGDIFFKSCDNNGNVIAKDSAAGICGGLINVNTSIDGCNNNGDITADNYAGGVIARTQKDKTNNYTISKCSNGGKVKSKRYCGGIVAYSETNLLLIECDNSGDISCVDEDYVYAYSGGVLGQHTRYMLSIINCVNTSNVISSGTAGGVLGNAYGAKSVIIDLCKNEGKITPGTYASGGGIVGTIASYDLFNEDGADYETINFVISNCENYGESQTGILAKGSMFYEEYPELQYLLLVENCNNYGIIKGSAGIATNILGQENSKCVIKNCINYSNINYQNDAAGIYNNDASGNCPGIFEIVDCKNEGNIRVRDGNAAGIATGNADNNYKIENCVNKGKIVVKSSEKFARYIASGITSSLSTGEVILYCTNYGEVSSHGRASGIAGYAHSIERCCNYGNINSLSYASGIAHEVESEVCQSINYGKVYVLADYDNCASGITYFGKVEDCINVGNVRCMQFQDGEKEGHVDVRAAGVSGYCSEITNSYNLGQVVCGPGFSNKVLASGIGSYMNKINGCINLSNMIEAQWMEDLFADANNYPRSQAIGLNVEVFDSGNNYYRSDGVLDEKVSIATGKDKEVFYAREIYDEAGWDFANVWEMPINGGLPVLKWQNLDEGLYMKDVTGEDEDMDYHFDFEASYTDHNDGGLQITGFVNSSLEYSRSRTDDGLLVYTIETTLPNLFIAPKVTTGATYKMYADLECTNEYGSDYVGLSLGNNFIYVKIEKDIEDEHKEAICIIYIVRNEEITVEGDRDIILPFEKTNLKIKWGPSLFMNNSQLDPQISPNIRNDKLAVVGLVLSAAAENSQSRVKTVATELGLTKFKSDYFDEPLNVNNPAYLIASEDIVLNGNKKTLITVVVRGTSGVGDGITDAIAQVGEESEQNGFREPAQNTYDVLLEYIENYYPEKKDELMFFITGHSLGGACAVLTGQLIKKDFPYADTFVYAFAPPKYTKFSENGSYIHQYINGNDAVPEIPYGYFPRVGNVYTFTGNTIALRDYWNGLITEDKPLPNVVPLPPLIHFAFDNNEYSNHSNNIYMAYLLHNIRSGYTLANIPSGERKLIFSVECPVDVVIKNARGKVLLSVINNHIDEENVADGFYASVDGDKKYILCTTKDDVKVELIGTDDGTMNYSIHELNYDSEPSKNKIYENVKLYQNKEFLFEIDIDDNVENTKLLIVDPDTKEAKYEVECDGNEIEISDDKSLSYTVKFVIDESTNKIIRANKGEFIDEPDPPSREGYIFDGWYKEVECINAWDFAKDVVTGNITLYAKWTAEQVVCNHIFSEWRTVKKPTNVADGLKERVCNKCGYKEEENIAANGFIVRVLDDSGNEIKNGHYSTLYTGAKITPSVNVYHKGVKLTENYDYKLSYGNNIAAANVDSAKAPFIKITGMGQYNSAITVNFEIRKVALQDCEYDNTVTVKKGSKLSPVIIYNGTEINKSSYTISKSDNWTEDGVLSVTAKNTGNFEGNISINVKTVEESQKAIKVLFSSEKLFYNGTSQIPKITVTDSKDSSLTLVKDVHYKVSVSNDTKTAGKHSVAVRGIGDYAGKIIKNYTINPIKLTKDDISYEVEKSVPFDSMGAKTTVKYITALVNGESVPLLQDIDYKIQYSNNKKVCVNQATYQISFINNYKGTASIKGTYSIEKANGSDFRIVTLDKVGYKNPGKYIVKPYVEYDSKTVAASDYTVKYYIDSALTKEMDSKENALTIPSGQDYATVYVKVTGKNNFSETAVVDEYKVYRLLEKEDLRLNMAGMKIDIEPISSAFCGDPCEPKTKVTYKSGTETKTLDASKYKIKYMNNLYKGTATIVITGNGVDALGSKTKTFSIKPGSVLDLSK